MINKFFLSSWSEMESFEANAAATLTVQQFNKVVKAISTR